MSSGELIHCYFGPLSNLIAAHFWNATTIGDTKSDVLYRGTTSHRTPRALFVDGKAKSNVFMEQQIDEHVPDDTDQLFVESGMGKQRNPALDDWSIQSINDTDENQHLEIPQDAEDPVDPKPDDQESSIGQLPMPEVQPDCIQLVSCSHTSEFSDVYSMGFDNSVFGIEQLFDPLRKLAEECDRMQGVHFVCDSNSAFGALTTRFLETMLDDWNKMTTFVSAVSHSAKASQSSADSTDTMTASTASFRKRGFDVLNAGFSTIEISGLASAFVPIDLHSLQLSSTSFLRFDTASDQLFSTAVVAAALDTMLCPLRAVHRTPGALGGYSLDQLCRTLRTYPSMRVSSFLGAVPFPLLTSNSLAGNLQTMPLFSTAFLRLSPGLPAPPSLGGPSEQLWRPPTVTSQAVVLRGILEDFVPLSMVSPSTKKNESARGIPPTDPESVLFEYAHSIPTMACLQSSWARPFPICSTFPTSILSPTAGFTQKGWLKPPVPAASPLSSGDPSASFPSPTLSPVPESLPMVSHLLTTTAIHPTLLASAKAFRGVPKAIRASFGGEMRSEDDFLEVASAMANLADEYAEYMDLDEEGADLSD